MNIPAKKFNLKHTLESGQFFRYYEKDGWYYCQERDKVFKIKQDKNKLSFEGTTSKHVKILFGLEHEYPNIIKKLKKDNELSEAVKQYEGLRLMRRDPWETLISFQCSVMSNIPKIRKNMNLLAQKFGNPKNNDYTFPNPGQINSLEKIKQCSTGFRAEWIQKVNEMVDDNYFEKLKKMNYNNAVSELIKLPGVGRKVADCICLFGLGKMQAFPVDVWIERIMLQKYGTDRKEIINFAQQKWGNLAGYAQQFLYHWGRNANT